MLLMIIIIVDDGETADDIDVDNVGVVGVEDNLGLNPQETWSLKH